MNKKEQVLVDFRSLFDKLAWLNKNKMEVSLQGYQSSEVHCIEYIGKHVDANVTKLAEAFYMTRGAMSKVTRKLINKDLIESYQKPENKKEIYFRLTEQGQKVFTLHEELHEEFRQRDQVVFEEITDEQYDTMLRFIENYKQHLDTEINKLNHANNET
ncbi:MarR family transcriptional regulator [Carnobacterium gallinarum]|uniref:MarR family transcriptional regulator n=1 Tax=Carnobacterium gallinarum TaxID=2749 RepID=UPI0005540F21|nr:MarR family transcriptional regulator [Carnobacterium gallinarum]